MAHGAMESSVCTRHLPWRRRIVQRMVGRPWERLALASSPIQQHCPAGARSGGMADGGVDDPVPHLGLGGGGAHNHAQGQGQKPETCGHAGKPVQEMQRLQPYKRDKPCVGKDQKATWGASRIAESILPVRNLRRIPDMGEAAVQNFLLQRNI